MGRRGGVRAGVAGEFVVCGLVEADADVSVGLAGGVFDLVFGEEAVGAGGLVAAPVDASPQEWLEVLVAVDVVAADVGCSSDEVDLHFGGFALGGAVGFEAVVAVGGLAAAAVEADESDVAGFEEPVEADSAKCPVVRVADQSRPVLGGLEVRAAPSVESTERPAGCHQTRR
ncbi:MAG TPA: hypothetical protein VLB85_07290 [Acidimicrobiia bacterium]|nr:hypothetical protein [Acidimicrobiia bacterium]